jgi:cytochrome oxidase Cu insertion factor (SCO1/SenC/PrrC family)
MMLARGPYGFLVAGLLAWQPLFFAPAANGAIPSGPNPDVVDQAGTRKSFHETIGGKVTVLHFMYPSCLSFCPVSGQMLARTQALLARNRPIRPVGIVSVSIVPREATPARLTGWLRQHKAAPGWEALHVSQRDLGPLLRYYGETVVDVQLHSSQILVLDPQGRIAKRFDDIPEPEALAAAIRLVAR